MGRGGEVTTNLIEFPTRRVRRRKVAPTRHWEPLIELTPKEALRLYRAGDHEIGTAGALPRRFENHALLWWSTPQFDRRGNLYSRFVTAGRYRDERGGQTRYPTDFFAIETVRGQGEQRAEVTRVDQSTFDLYRMVCSATRKVPGSRIWSREKQEQHCDDAAMMIAHRLDLVPLHGCEGVRAAMTNPSIVDREVEQHYPRATMLRRKKREFLQLLDERGGGDRFDRDDVG